MTYLLDTDTLSNLLKPKPAAGLVSRLAAIHPDDQCTSSISVGEMVFGARKLGHEGLPLLVRIDRLLVPNLRIVPFDREAAYEYGRIRADLERAGTPIGERDTLISGIALARGLTVVTGNIRHFDRVQGLSVESWL